MDDGTFPTVLGELQQELTALLAWLGETPELDMATAETAPLKRLREVGCTCACGEPMRFEGYRATQVQTLVGWISVRRAVDVAVVTPMDIDRYRDSPGLVTGPALRDGREIYSEFH